jgi:hypothetical protein
VVSLLARLFSPAPRIDPVVTKPPEGLYHDPARKVTGSGPFCVYFHADVTGKIFYVGMGSQRRSVQTNGRTVHWHRYRDQRSGSRHTVHIVSWHATSEEALEVEASYIHRWTKQLVNVDESSKSHDPAALAKFMALSRDYRDARDQADALRKTDPGAALGHYRRAIDLGRERDGARVEIGLHADLLAAAGIPAYGDLTCLDGVTRCLFNLGRFQELDEVVRRYLAEFPQPPSNKARMDGVMKRHAKALLKL